ncbi:MAG: hypothetical protein MUE85_12810 [Microscillaceae bacterium]|jgi:DNA-directed RNA polymerase subunit RPC12/RpoP|nr:hypothetical protein [Microscillaceae bacterium]
MLKLKIEDIFQIRKNVALSGYEIEFENGTKIYLTKRRTIISLLILIKYGEGTEADLAKGSNKIAEIKQILGDKIPEGYIQEFYGDANKPYSELWNEEGFTWIDNLKGGRSGKSQKYILKIEDYFKFFEISHKAFRKSPSNAEKELIRQKQNYKCNLCGAKILEKSKIKPDTYAKDRRKEVFDHRIPIEKGGKARILTIFKLCVSIVINQNGKFAIFVL